MEITQSRQGAVTVLKPAGPLVGDDAAQFLREAREAAQRSLGRLVIDVSAVPYVDSGGLEALLDVTESISEGGRSLRLCAAAETLREVLDITGLSERFEHYEDVHCAVRSFL
jgi:anti-anti-sigma factor